LPKLLIISKYIFLVFSADLSEKRKHIHVEARKGRFRKSAKFWIEPEIEIVDSGDFSKREINELQKLIKINKSIIENQIDKFLSGKKIKTIKL
jgi:hypothetical protein